MPENIAEYNNGVTDNGIKSNGDKSTKSKRKRKHLACVFFYTGFVFWGLSLDIKELKFNSWRALILLITEYSFGVICLAYLANYIITN